MREDGSLRNYHRLNETINYINFYDNQNINTLKILPAPILQASSQIKNIFKILL